MADGIEIFGANGVPLVDANTGFTSVATRYDYTTPVDTSITVPGFDPAKKGHIAFPLPRFGVTYVGPALTYGASGTGIIYIVQSYVLTGFTFGGSVIVIRG